jgi:hypothetical protein
MRLYQVSSPETQQTVFQGAALMFEGSGASLWVNGTSTTLCSVVKDNTSEFIQSTFDCQQKLQSFCEKVISL